MPNKRLIFSLLYASGKFMLSRNFRLQQVGNFEWLSRNYNFFETATAIDELVVINVERDSRPTAEFLRHLQQLNDFCFVPITAGGGIREFCDAKEILSNGADKVLINTIAATNPDELERISETFGRQSVVLGVDLVKSHDQTIPVVNCGREVPSGFLDVRNYLNHLNMLPFGEWYVNSVDRDGTGLGFDSELLDLVPTDSHPLILAGGASKPEHFCELFEDSRVSALATAHLLNFVNDGLHRVRARLLDEGHDLPQWNPEDHKKLRNSVNNV